MKPNPCALCGRQPFTSAVLGEVWTEKYQFVQCLANYRTHTVETNGKTLAEAIERWNRLNPPKEARRGK